MERKIRLFLLNQFNGARSWETDVYQRIFRLLSGNGKPVICPTNFNIESRINFLNHLQTGDIVIAHQPYITPIKPGVNTFCEPSGIHSRSSRLEFLDKAGFPTMEWIDANSITSMSELFKLWNTDIFLYKKSKSFQSNGIKLINKRSVLPEIQKGDVFCKIITHDPYTYKVDFFHDMILGAYLKQTPSVLNVHYWDWIRGDNRNQLDYHNQNRQYFQLPEKLSIKIQEIGKLISQKGGGYSSIDLMNTKNGFKAIELNISEIATKYTWLTRPNQYSKNFAKGILNLCRDYS